MFGSSVLEVAIGVVFVYLLFSLICTVVNEGIASLCNQRGKNLFDGIRNLLNDPEFTGLAQQIYSHGLVDGISQNAADSSKPNRLPSYMSSGTFALALLDIMGSRGVGASWPAVIAQRQRELDDAKAKQAADSGNAELKKAVADAQAVLDKAVEDASKAKTSEQKHQEAQRAAQAVKGFKDLKKIQEASAKLEEALAAGRELAARHPDPLGNFEQAVAALGPGHTKESLQVLVDKTRREIAVASSEVVSIEHQAMQLQRNVEGWFNTTMDRVSGWYKRWTQVVSLATAFLVVFVANADTIMLTKRLTRDNVLRASLVSAADKAAQSKASENDQAQQELLKQAAGLDLPLGWMPAQPAGANPSAPNYAMAYRTDQVPDSFAGWVMKFLGLMISVFAVSLGAPFWFDTLGKLTNLRGSGKQPDASQKPAL